MIRLKTNFGQLIELVFDMIPVIEFSQVCVIQPFIFMIHSFRDIFNFMVDVQHSADLSLFSSKCSTLTPNSCYCFRPHNEIHRHIIFPNSNVLKITENFFSRKIYYIFQLINNNNQFKFRGLKIFFTVLIDKLLRRQSFSYGKRCRNVSISTNFITSLM